MPHDVDPKFKRYWTKDQLKGRHHLTLTPPSLNSAFLAECEKERRVPSDWLRIILEDRYSNKIRYPKSVEVKPRGAQPIRKQEVA